MRMISCTASEVSHSDGILLSAALVRFTFSRMSSAFLAQTKVFFGGQRKKGSGLNSIRSDPFCSAGRADAFGCACEPDVQTLCFLVDEFRGDQPTVAEIWGRTRQDGNVAVSLRRDEPSGKPVVERLANAFSKIINND